MVFRTRCRQVWLQNLQLSQLPFLREATLICKGKSLKNCVFSCIIDLLDESANLNLMKTLNNI